MKVYVFFIAMVLTIMLCFGTSFAMQHEASVQQGKALFSDPKLGTNGKTCFTCHANGKGLEQAGAKSELADTINMCITNPLKGKALGTTSSEMQSLILYIKSLGERKPAATKKAPVGC